MFNYRFCPRQYIFHAIIAIIIVSDVSSLSVSNVSISQNDNGFDFDLRISLEDKKDVSEVKLKSFSQDPQKENKFLPKSLSTLGKYKKAAVVSNGRICSQIGLNILKKGGNAVEAAIATSLCDGVLRIMSMGVGGGFIMTFYQRKTKRASVLVAKEKAPLAAFENMYHNETWASQVGAKAAGVPGELKGYQAAYERFQSGNIQWADLFDPVIKLCETGIPVSEFVAHNLFVYEKEIRISETLSKVLLKKDGTIPKLNDTIILPTLAKTLKVIAYNPKKADALYDGILTKPFVEDIQNAGGIITEKDMASYSVKWMRPVTAKLKGDFKLHTGPPPSSGVIIAFIMELLSKLVPSEDGKFETDLIRIVETFKHAFGKRSNLNSKLTPKVLKVIKQILNPAYVNKVVNNITKTSGMTSQDYHYYGGNYFLKTDHGTGNIVVLAPNGDAVSLTSSINWIFGSFFMSNSTGILLNNHMNDFSLSSNNIFGSAPSKENFIEPGKRPMSSMSPTIITDNDGNVRLAIGGAGGPKIISSVSFVSMLHLWFGKNISDAINKPRIHHELMPMVLMHEHNVDKDTLKLLKKHGHKLASVSYDDSSCVTAISQENGNIFASADFRWDGGSVSGF